MTTNEAYENLRAEMLAAFDKYMTETKGRTLTDREIAGLFREMTGFTEALDFNQV